MENLNRDSNNLQQTSAKSGAKSAKKYSKHLKAADNNSSSLLKKIQLFPISKKSKETLSNLVISHTIHDITKLVKISNKSVTLHGKVNIKNTGDIMDVIIKVYSEFRKFNEKLYAYSRNINNEEKPIIKDVYPTTINSDPDYLKEHIVYYKDDNIVILKMFKDCKTIEQMIKSFPDKKKQFFVELLELYMDLKKRDCYLWQNCACTVKNILWHNGKWIFLSTNCGYGYCHGKRMDSENILNITYLFKSYGLSNKELTNEIKDQMRLKIFYCDPFNVRGFFEKNFPLEKSFKPPKD